MAIYRSMVPSENLVGTWSEYLQVPVLGAVILPDTVKPIDYSGSLVNILTPFAFLKDVMAKNHKALICTAGSSATGIAMLGLCQAYHIPLISIVRNDESRVLVEKLGGSHIVIESHPDFKARLTQMAQELGVTVVFDGVGGATLSEIIETLPQNTMIYSYGYLGGATPLTLHTSNFNFKGIKIEGFANTRCATVKNHQMLEKALKEIEKIIHQPHFKTAIGKTFALESITDALAYSGEKGERAVLTPS